MRFSLKKIIKDVVTIIKKPVMSILPGQLAFSFVLTIIPTIALIAIIATTFSMSLDSITDFINESFPSAVSNLLLPLINGRGFDLSILIFLITAFVLASGGAYSIMTASDVIYGIENKNIIAKRIKSFIMTFILILLIMFLLIVPAFGDKIITILTNFGIFAGIKKEIFIVYYLLKYPITFLCVYSSIKLIYTISPNRAIKSKTVTTGALFTTISWMLVTQIYSFWVGSIAHYDIFYGSISNIIILLTWMYILAYLFVIGLVMNAGINIENGDNI